MRQQQRQQLESAVGNIVADWNHVDAPTSWQSQFITRDENGIDWHQFQLTGFPLATNSTLRAGDSDFHFMMSSGRADRLDPSDFTFRNTREGGVFCDPPRNVPRRNYYKQFHSFTSDPECAAGFHEIIENACAERRAVTIGGLIFDSPLHPDFATDPAAVMAHGAGKFRGFDRSNACPICKVQSIKIWPRPPEHKTLNPFAGLLRFAFP